jgi:hypothetical protein
LAIKRCRVADFACKWVQPLCEADWREPQEVRLAKVLIVHGISNQYGGEAELLSAWYPALCDGLSRARAPFAPAQSDCFCPFYGDLFRPIAHLGGNRSLGGEDLAQANKDETDLLDEIWRSAAETDPKVPGPDEYGESLARVPRFVERALNSLARSQYLARRVPLQFFGDLKQVVAYLDNPDIHQKAMERVFDRIGSETRLVIGHSLGSVVAYEVLCQRPGANIDLITVGSPLGIPNVVFHKLTPRPGADGVGQWPSGVRYWTNIAARGDIVAAQKELASLFAGQVEDKLIENGGDAHNSTRYLNTLEAGVAILRALS